jgi:dTDP-4-amino-4,6-dideoxygalactose transaminase
MADVLDVNGCIDPQQVEMVLTPRTRCIMPVHLYGFPCDMDALMQLANSHGIYVLEDNAQAQGATWKGQKTGSIGHLAATSFYPTKNLGALGDGGALTTQLESLSTRILALRNYGSSQKYDHREVGVNSRLDELQAAFLQVKLPLLNTWNAERAKLAGYYTEALRGIPGLQLPEAMPGSEPAFHLFPIRVTLRNALAQYLAQQGIGTRIHYPLPNHLQPAFAYLGYQKGDFPVAEAIAATTLSLPLYPGLNEELVARVTAAIRHFFQS